MRKRDPLPVPVTKALRKIGADINDARRRRRITMSLMAERAGTSRTTIRSIEKGNPTTSMGAYAAVLFVLGMLDRLGSLADTIHDVAGRRLEDEELPIRVRSPKNKALS